MLQHASVGRERPAHPASALDDYHFVSRAIEFLGSRWDEHPDLDTIARHLGLSPGHVQRLFKRWCGLSPKEFVQAVTVREARSRLDADESVLNTSIDVGLSGPGRLHDLFVTHEAMTPGEYKRRGAGLEMSYGFHASPFGLAVVMTTERGIAGLGFADDDSAEARSRALGDLTRRWPAAQFTEAPDRTAPCAAAVFGRRAGSHEPLRVVLIGTAFDLRVWETLLRVPAGRTTTYGRLARDAGSPSAHRAVASAVGRNPISFVVPCHRVVRSDGELGGYHWGVTRKRAIIGWERASLKPRPAGSV
jgi:AraC family transcriptional regulator of adaptative response/methylated-DNA-[protein]-cysteine methyltransferase